MLKCNINYSDCQCSTTLICYRALRSVYGAVCCYMWATFVLIYVDTWMSLVLVKTSTIQEAQWCMRGL